MARTSVAKQEDTRAVVPQFMRESAGKGTEDWSSTDYEMPRIKLIQGISPELQTYDGLKAGDFFHTIAEIGLGSELTVVPIHFSKRFVLWRPRPPIDQGGILARADDSVHWVPADAEFKVKIDKKGTEVIWRTARTVAESRLANWGTYDPSDPNSQPAATESHVVVVALPDYPELSPVALFMQRASIGTVRRLRGKLKISGAPIYGTKFLMSSILETSSAGQFNNYTFTAAGFVEDQDQYETYEQMYESFKATGVQIRDLEQAQSDEPAGGGVDAAAAAAAEKRF